MSQAMSETVAQVNRSRAFMPPGTAAPFIMRFDAGSVAVGYLVFSTDDPNISLNQMQDQALIITYARDIDSEDLVEATRDQWRAQGVLQQEPQSEAWLRMLASLWPDVGPGAQLAFVLTTSRDSSGTARLPHRELSDPWVRLSRKRSVAVFWGSGLIPARNTLSCVSS